MRIRQDTIQNRRKRLERLRIALNKSIIALVIAAMSFVLPISVLAETVSPEPSPAVVQADISHPMGADAKTYSYNEEIGLWENEHYTFNPVTKETRAKTAPEYTYNPGTGLWDSFVWEYATASDHFIQTPFSVATPPEGAVRHGGPAPVVAPAAPVTSAEGTQTDPAAGSNAQAAVAPSELTDTAPSNQTDQEQTSAGDIGVVQNLAQQNTIASWAQTGNASAYTNMTAGNVTSGNADAIATILNLLQSSSSLGGSGFATFQKDIQGDASGNLVIDPAAYIQPAAVDAAALGRLALNAELNGSIANDIDLNAVTGNALAGDNTHVGNATSGDANAVANVVNMINSVIAANQSFIGVVNIYGNYTGDILVPAASLNALLASNAPVPASNLALVGGANDSSGAQSTTNTQDFSANTSADQQVSNNVDLAAKTGNATIDNNYQAGNATTGEALTRLTILNLTGHQVTAENSLLVFVNVLGKWIGVIMDAPAGSTAAALVGGQSAGGMGADTTYSQSSNGSGQTTDQTSESARDINLASSMHITNNIKAHATTGDAALTDNYIAGNATTGKASASANIANLLNSQFSLSHWFGVLFINVFGSWIGNFGVAQPEPAPTTVPGTSAPGPDIRVFGFAPSAATSRGLARITSGNFGSGGDYDDFMNNVEEVLAVNDVINPPTVGPVSDAQNQQAGFSLISFLPVLLGLGGLTAVGVDRVRSAHRKVRHGVRRMASQHI